MDLSSKKTLIGMAHPSPRPQVLPQAHTLAQWISAQEGPTQITENPHPSPTISVASSDLEALLRNLLDGEFLSGSYDSFLESYEEEWEKTIQIMGFTIPKTPPLASPDREQPKVEPIFCEKGNFHDCIRGMVDEVESEGEGKIRKRLRENDRLLLRRGKELKRRKRLLMDQGHEIRE